MKQNINIEAEGNELVLKNKAGDYVIVPKKYRLEVQDMIKENCHSCIDKLVETLPVMEDYAEDGSVISNDKKNNFEYKSYTAVKDNTYVAPRVVIPLEQKKKQQFVPREQPVLKADNRTDQERKIAYEYTESVLNPSIRTQIGEALQKPLRWIADPIKGVGDIVSALAPNSALAKDLPNTNEETFEHRKKQLNPYISNKEKINSTINEAIPLTNWALLNTLPVEAAAGNMIKSGKKLIKPVSKMVGKTDDAIKVGSKVLNKKEALSKLSNENKINLFETFDNLADKSKNISESFMYELNTLHKKLNPSYQKRAKKELKYANKWQEKWYNHPETTKRLQSLSDEFGIYGTENEWTEIIERINDKNYTSTFQSKDAKLQKILKGEERTHKGNYGVSGHYLDKDYSGVRQNLVDKYSSKIKSTAIHEGNHGLTEGNQFIPRSEQEEMVKIFGKDKKIPERNEKMEFNTYDEYLENPTEIYARMMELREYMGKNPGELVSADEVEKLIQFGKNGNTPVDSYFFSKIQDKEKLKKLFNRLPAITPLIGISYIQSQQQNKTEQ